VHLARSPGGRRVTIKVIRPELAEDTDFRARFARKVSAARADAAISIHADGGPPGGRGFAILEPVADGPDDAVIGPSVTLGADLRAAFASGTREPVSSYDGTDGVKFRDDLAGLNLSRVPKVFIECANMRNAADAALVTSRGGRRRQPGRSPPA